MADKSKRFKTATGLHVTDPRHLEVTIPPAPSKAGRPSTFTPELAERVLEQVAQGKFIVDIGGDRGLPAWRTIYRWADARSDFRQDLAHAHEEMRLLTNYLCFFKRCYLCIKFSIEC